MAGALDDRAPDLSAHFRQYEDLDEIVLEVHHLPLPRFALRRISLEAVVGIQARIAGKDRDRVRLGERVGREDPRLFPNVCGLPGGRRGEPAEGERQRDDGANGIGEHH